MTPRERWLAVLERRDPDRIPCDFWGTPEVLDRLVRDLRCKTEDDLWPLLGVDKVYTVEPRFIGPEDRKDNLWNLRFLEQEYGDGMGTYRESLQGPLSEMREPEELEDFSWPDPAWFDYSTVPDQVALLSHWPLRAGWYEPFYLYCSMRGLEQAYLDLAENQEFLDAAIERIFEFHYEHNLRIYEAAGKKGGILFTYIAEDLGGQRSLLMNPRLVERFFLPRMKEMTDLAHRYGVRAFHHDDGAIRPILPRLIEIGIDILNPIQWRCPGMEREALKRDFGDALVFHGGVDNQRTLPFGSPQEVREEVFENIRTLGAGGGYIVAPCHNIQPISSTENILALYEAVAEA